MSKSKAYKGMVAHRVQDSKNSSVTKVEYVPAPPCKAKRIFTKCSICGKPMSFRDTAFIPNPVICTQCKDKAANEQRKAIQAEIASRIHCTCKICGKPFYIKAAKAKQLKDAGMALFTTCYSCQQKRKAMTKDVSATNKEGE